MSASPAPTTPKFDNFRDAFCHAYKCRPDRYESRLFFASLHSLRTLPALPIWWFNRPLFAVDLDVINNLGRTGSTEEFVSVLRDLDSANHIERSIRRGIFKIRVNPEKLRLIREDIDYLIDPPKLVNVLEGSKVAIEPMPLGTGASPGSSSTSGPGRAVATSSRRLREAHRDLTAGRSLESFLAESKVSEDELIAEAAEAGKRAPEMRWLHGYLLQLQKLRSVEAEHERLRRVLAAQAHELLDLRAQAAAKREPQT